MRASVRHVLILVLGWLVFSAGIAALQGCSGKSVNESDPASLMADAEDDIKSDHFQIAIDKLRMIRNKFPYSKYSIDAQLRLADVYFMQESYAEAAANYESFADLHPKHEKVPYALYRVGKSYFNDIPNTIARDLTPAQKSLDAYTTFLARFPNAKESDDARKDANEARNLLANKELYIGDFYFKRDFYDSALPRYKKLVELYPGTDAAKKAEEKIAQIAQIAPDAGTRKQTTSETP